MSYPAISSPYIIATEPEKASDAGITIHIGRDVLQGGSAQGQIGAVQLYALAERAQDQGQDDACSFLLELAQSAELNGGSIAPSGPLPGRKPASALLPVGFGGPGAVDPMADFLSLLKGDSAGYGGVTTLDSEDEVGISKALPNARARKTGGDPSDPTGTPARHSPILSQFGAYTGLKDPQSVTGRHMQYLQATSLVPSVWAIQNTRAQQVADYSEWSDDSHSKGWRIRTKDPNAPITPGVRERIAFLRNLVQYGGQPRDSKGKLRRHPLTGQPGVWSGPGGASGDEHEAALPLHQYLKVGTFDTLTYDSFAVRSESGRNAEKFPVVWASPADSMRIWPTIASGPYRRRPQIDGRILDAVQWVEVSPDGANQVVREYDYKSMDVLVRNPRMDTFAKGFGRSETEIALEIIVALTNGIDFAKSYFDKNHMPAGILEIVGQLVNNRAGVEYVRQQMARIGGPEGLFKILLMPFAAGQQGAGLKFHPIRGQTGATAELALIEPWFNFLYNQICAVFSINSEEVGFSAVKVGGPSLSQGGQGITLEHSREKGLYPLLKAHAEFINRQRIQPYDPDDEFVFEFTGMQVVDASLDEELRTKRMARGVTLNQIRDDADEERLRMPLFPHFYANLEKRYNRSSYPSTAEWRIVVDKRYEKEYWALLFAAKEKSEGKPLDELDKSILEMTTPPWANYTDAPVSNPQAMMSFEKQQGDLMTLLGGGGGAQPPLGPDGQPLDPNAGGLAQTPDGQQFDPADPFGHGDQQAQQPGEEPAPNQMPTDQQDTVIQAKPVQQARPMSG